VGHWAKERGIPYTTYTDLSQQPDVCELILEEVRHVNGRLPDPMRVGKFILLHKPFDADDEELTRTGKVRRKWINEHYHRLFEAMDSDEEVVEVRGKIQYRNGTIGTTAITVRVMTVA
jgi:long-chain acyl-CoA synthetase